MLSNHNSIPFQAQPPVSSLPLPEPGTPRPLFAGVNAVWRKLLVQAEMVAPHLQVATVEGDPGSGKQTLARYLHSRSLLARSVFQRHDARQWLVIESDPASLEGFLYLDRVDLLGRGGQDSLLSVIKKLQDQPPGRAILVASSRCSVRQMAGQGNLIPDLAFRLTAVRFAIPPLRQRREDIAPLAQVLLDRICARYHQRPMCLGPGTLARLLQHNWPGNVRELASVLETAMMDAENGVIQPADLLISAETELHPRLQPAGPGHVMSLDAAIRRHVQFVLDLNHGNKLRAARQLGISRSTLYRLLAGKGDLVR